VIGDFTGLIGDPTGKSETRRALTRAEVEANAQTYREQVFKILDPERTRVVFNSAWLAPLRAEDVIRMTAQVTVARLLSREDFALRYEEERPIHSTSSCTHCFRRRTRSTSRPTWRWAAPTR